MALDRVIQGKIADVVTGWVNEGKTFTAFEVSLAVKEQGVRERHRNMRDHVHEVIFQLGGPKNYSRTLMDVGAPEQAWVYHPKDISPYRYRPLDRTGNGPEEPIDDPHAVVPSLRNPRALAWASAAQANVPPGAYGTDSRGRLCIPVPLLQAIGVAAGQRVKVQCDPAQETLTVTMLGDRDVESVETTYTAEGDGNVRLTQTTLDKAGIGGMQCYRIDGSDSGIMVRAFED